MFGKVAVLLGGNSSEREISLLSGKAILEALLRQGVDAHAIDARDNYIERLQREGFARVFIALHGGDGENGVVQGVLEALRIPYTGSGVTGSAVAMDKIKSKRIWYSLGLPTAPFTIFNEKTDPQEMIKLYGFPFIVKPVLQGSTVGVHKAVNIAELQDAYTDASQFGPVMMEQYIAGDEYTVGIVGTRALPSIQIVFEEQILDWNAKYKSSKTKRICPSPLTAKQELYLQKLALEAFFAVGASGFGRVDFIRDLNGDFWLLEINTIPGFTDHSFVPVAAKAAGLSFDQLVIEILSQTFTETLKTIYIDAYSKASGS